jgi:hypothetical protein
MGSGEHEKGLRHNPRHKNADSARDRWIAKLMSGARAHPEFSYFRKWGVKFDDPDLRIQAILENLYRVWPRFAEENRELYLRTAESIAAAEKAKVGWNPKASRERYARVAKNAVAAAQLAAELAVMFPPPWTGERAPIGTLLEGLASFVGGAVPATRPWELTEATIKARVRVQITKKRLQAKGVQWELLRDLAWLASGRTVQLDERSIRRYLDEPTHPKDPAARYWKRNWERLVNAVQLAPRTHASTFTDAVKAFLQSSLKS